MTFIEAQKIIAKSEAKKSILEDTLNKLTDQYENELELQKSIDEAHSFLQLIAQETQEHLKYHIEDIVNLAINMVFPDKYTFKILFEIKRGQTEARIFLLSDDGTEVDPMDESGGGIVDVTAFALRIAAWTLSKTRNTIILDEPFRFISEDLQPAAGEILKSLSHKLNLQFIIVTHNKEIVSVSDRVFEVYQKNKKSVVEVAE